MSMYNQIFNRLFYSKKHLQAENNRLHADNACLLKELHETQAALQAEQAKNAELQVTVAQTRDKLINAEAEIKQIPDKLDVASHNAKYKLIKRINELGEMDMEQLRAVGCSFDVYASSEIEDPYDFGDDDTEEAVEAPEAEEAAEKPESEENAEPVKWAVVTAYCQYGGCDLCVWFDDERSARIYAILRTENGFPVGQGLCNSCRREYYENCV